MEEKIRLRKDGKPYAPYPKYRKSPPCSEEKKKKISESNLGKRKSLAHCLAISESHKGKSPWNKGRKTGHIPWNKDKRLSNEIRKKLSLAHITTGTTSANEKARSSIELKRWRKRVFRRDDYTCRKCFQKGGTLNAHHIGSFSENPKFRFVTDNGITFCGRCHREYHRIYGQKKFNGDTIILFLPTWKQVEQILEKKYLVTQ